MTNRSLDSGGPAPRTGAVRRAPATIFRWLTTSPLAHRLLGILALGAALFSLGARRLRAAPPEPDIQSIKLTFDAQMPEISTSATLDASGKSSEALPREPQPGVTHPPRAGPATPDNPVCINEAAVHELRRLPGIGDKRASNIVALRQRLGKIRRIEDLLRVRGIGRKRLAKLKPLIRFECVSALDSGTAIDAMTLE